MLTTIRTVVSCTFAALLISAIAPLSVSAQPGRICNTDGDYEPRSTTTRIIELRDFGIAVAIPENYRAMRQQNGSVSILHPDDFEWIQCLARGGDGGGGFYSEQIRQVNRDPAMSLREQATWTAGYSVNRDGTRTPAATSITHYQQNGLDGYIVTSISGYGVTFLGTTPGSNQLLEVSASCDCDVEVEAVTDLLARIRLLQ